MQGWGADMRFSYIPVWIEINSLLISLAKFGYLEHR